MQGYSCRSQHKCKTMLLTYVIEESFDNIIRQKIDFFSIPFPSLAFSLVYGNTSITHTASEAKLPQAYHPTCHRHITYGGITATINETQLPKHLLLVPFCLLRFDISIMGIHTSRRNLRPWRRHTAFYGVSLSSTSSRQKPVWNFTVPFDSYLLNVST